MAVIACIPNRDDKIDYYILDEYFANTKSTDIHAKAIQVLMDKWMDIDLIYIDSAAQQTKYDLASIYDIGTINAKKSVLDGIGLVGGLVDNNRVFVAEHCVECIFALRNYKWKTGTETEKPEHDRASHMADAIRYALYTYSLGQGVV
jgi:phage terminase large subunit